MNFAGSILERDWVKFLTDYGLYIGLGLIALIFSLLSPHFLSVRNIMNIVRQSSIIGVIAVGMTFVILMGDFDLSVGSLVALSGVMVAILHVEMDYSPVLSVILTVTAVTMLGFLTGTLVVKFHVPAFVATLGMMSSARGLALIISEGYPISGFDPSLRTVGAGMVGPLPTPVIIFISLVGITYIILRETKFGRLIYGIGGNLEAVKLSGINVDKYKIIVFGISALSAALSGIILAARVNSGQPTAGMGYELDVISAVVIGGTSLQGGKGGIIGTFFGALLIGVLRNGFNLLGIPPFYQQLVQGIVIVAAVMLDQIRE